MHRPTITHITTVPRSLSFLHGQPGYMDERGFATSVISSPGEELDRFKSAENVVTHAVEMPRKITPLHDLGALRRLRSVLRLIRPAIVHAHTPKGGLLGMIGATLARVPVRIYHIRGFPYMTATGRQRLLLKTTERISCRLAHRVFCVSHSLREVAIADGICPANKVVVFRGGSGNGVDATGTFDPQRLSPGHRTEWKKARGIDASAVVIGFVGRLVRDKGVVELAEAWQSLHASHRNAHLALAGPFEERDPVDAQTRQSLVSDPRVHLLGQVDDIAAFYAACDTVVLPTYREGFPNVLLEAAAMQVPVVATRIPGCIDAVEDNVTGTLVPPRDVAALARAIDRYLADPALRAQHGQAARQRVLRDFRQEDIWEAIYQEYVELLRAKGQPVPASPRE